jgi:hypothetical protein
MSICFDEIIYLKIYGQLTETVSVNVFRVERYLCSYRSRDCFP